jgi:DNA-binding transcriptional regulator LsrR (DeoR family)
MRDVGSPAIDERDQELCARAAWLYHGAGLTQGEVARRLGVPSVKAHRLIARANRLGFIHVSIDAPVAACVHLENQLQRKFGLEQCVVAPELDDGPLPLRSLGLSGGRFLRLAIESGMHQVIGVGHGRTLASCVNHLSRMDVPDLKLVSLLGGMTRRYVTTPFDVIHRLAEKTNAAAYVLPLPFLANTPEDRKVLLEQRGVADVFELGVKSTLRLVGIGAIDDDASILSTGLVERHEFEEARALGAVGELLGHLFSSRGHLIESGVSARALSMSAADIEQRATVAVAGGEAKVHAIRGVLASGLLHGLITDENTARSLVDEPSSRT